MQLKTSNSISAQEQLLILQKIIYSMLYKAVALQVLTLQRS